MNIHSLIVSHSSRSQQSQALAFIQWFTHRRSIVHVLKDRFAKTKNTRIWYWHFAHSCTLYQEFLFCRYIFELFLQSWKEFFNGLWIRTTYVGMFCINAKKLWLITVTAICVYGRTCGNNDARSMQLSCSMSWQRNITLCPEWFSPCRVK